VASRSTGAGRRYHANSPISLLRNNDTTTLPPSADQVPYEAAVPPAQPRVGSLPEVPETPPSSGINGAAHALIPALKTTHPASIGHCQHLFPLARCENTSRPASVPRGSGSRGSADWVDAPHEGAATRGQMH
jgi:hypothetical protein